MNQCMINALQNLNQACFLLAEQQRRFSMDLQKLLIAIQGNEAEIYLGYELGGEALLKQVIRLAEQAQNIPYDQADILVNVNKEIDHLTRNVIEQQNEILRQNERNRND